MESTSKKSAIIDMATKGVDVASIAASLNTSAKHVHRVLHVAREAGADIPRLRSYRDTLVIKLTDDLDAKLCEEAERRRLTKGQLAQALVSITLRDDMVSAVLDEVAE